MEVLVLCTVSEYKYCMQISAVFTGEITFLGFTVIFLVSDKLAVQLLPIDYFLLSIEIFLPWRVFHAFYDCIFFLCTLFDLYPMMSTVEAPHLC